MFAHETSQTNGMPKFISMLRANRTIWAVIAFILLCNSFCKFRIVAYSETTNTELNIYSEEQWSWNNKGEYYTVMECSTIPQEVEISFFTGSSSAVTISHIKFYYGNILLKKMTAESLNDESLKGHGVYMADNQIMVENGSSLSINMSSIFFAVLLIRKMLFIFAIILLCTIRVKDIWNAFSEKMLVLLHALSKKFNSAIFFWTMSFAVIASLLLFNINRIANLLAVSEFLFFIAAFFFIALIISTLTHSKKEIVFFSLFALIPLYFSLERISEYLLVDEPRAINEQLFLSSDTFRHWYFGSSRMNYSIMGTLLKVIPDNLLNVLGINGSQYAKLLHWLVAIVLVGYICRMISAKCIASKHRQNSFYFALSFGLLLSISVLLSTLKFYNYDTYAVLFGMIGVLFLYRALKENSYRLSIISLVFSSMALQEKNIALPYFGLSMIICSVLGAKSNSLHLKKYGILKASFLAMAIPISVFGLTTFYVSVVLRGSMFSNITFGDIVSPFTAIFEKVFQGLHLNIAAFGFFDEIIVFVSLAFLTLFTRLYIVMSEKMPFANGRYKGLFRIIRCGGNQTFFIMLLIWTIGIVCMYCLPIMYVSPAYPNTENYYISSTQLTALNVYFPASNALQDTLSFIGALYGLNINALPTIISLFGVVSLWCQRRHDDQIWNSLFLFTQGLIPIVYGVLHLVPWLRYMNIYICIAMVLLIIKFCSLIDAFLYKYKIILFIAAYTFAALETYSFAPVYYAFWPIWNRMPHVYEYANVGETMTVWQGGIGEDLSIGGKLILDYCAENKIDTSSIKIYSNYHGIWNSELNVERMPGWRKRLVDTHPAFTLDDFYFDDTSFYIYSRWGLSLQTLPYEFPKDVEPLLEIQYRGCTEAWIFSGSQLQAYITEYVDSASQ